MDGKKKIIKKAARANLYKNFASLDGSHPLKESVPDAFVDYPARIRKGGELKFFNFAFQLVGFALIKSLPAIPKACNITT